MSPAAALSLSLDDGAASAPRASRSARPVEPSHQRSALKELVADLAVSLHGHPPAEVESQLSGAVRRIGEACGADRVALYRFSSDGRLATSLHGWSRIQRRTPVGRLTLSCDPDCLWASNLRRGVEVYIPQVSILPDDASVWTEVMEDLEVRSVALLPLLAGDSVLGFVSMLATDSILWWDSEALRLVRGAVGVIASSLRRGQTETALADVQGNLHTLLDELADYLFILDTAGRILHANPSACGRLGFQLAEMRQLTAADVFHLERRAEAASFLKSQVGRAAALVPLVTRGGGTVSVEASLTRGRWSQQEVLFAVCRDITDRERAVDRLRRNEKRTSAILNAIPDAMLRLRADGSVRGFTPGDVARQREMGGRCGDDLARRIAAGCREAVTRTLVTGEMQVHELTLENTSGQRTFEIRLVVMGDDEVLAIVRDISERARLEQMKADFINRASHELRTPLTTAQLMVDLIQEGGDDEELDEYWRVLRLELQRQRDLVEDLLTVGRLETGRLQLNLTPVQLDDTIAGAVSNASRLATARQIEVTCQVPDGLPTVQADVSAMQRVLANLLENAVKFTPAGGVVRVAAQVDGDGLQINVSDNGIGIPPDDLPQLFQRFFRASNAVRAEIQGTGVGLHIVHSIVEGHGGRVTVDSIVDEGTTFRVWLPVAEDGRRQAPTASARCA